MSGDRVGKEASEKRNRHKEEQSTDEFPSAESQMTLNLSPANILQLQHTIGNQAVQRLIAQSQTPQIRRGSVAVSTLQRNPVSAAAKAIGKRAIAWLTATHGRTISKHILRHAADVAGRAVHTVFKNPTRIKALVRSVLNDPTRVVLQQGARIISGGERVLGSAPIRYVFEKDFGTAVGKAGETIIRVVVSKTGKIITAYPVKEFVTTGAASAAMFVALDSASAEAQEKFAEVAATAQRMEEAEEDSFLEELFLGVITFGLYGGNLNEGESADLWAGRETRKIEQQAIEQVIAAAELEADECFGPETREQIADLVRSALAMPAILDALDE